MNDGAPVVYHGNGSYVNGPGPVYMVGQYERTTPRQYPLELLQFMGGVREGNSPAQGTPRRPNMARRERLPSKNGSEVMAFGYESDDSSLSSNASGSAKSTEKADGAARLTENGGQPREWRQRSGPRPQQNRARPRIAPERFLNSSYPFQVKFTPDDLLNGSKWDTLSQEIWDKFVTSQQTEETFRKKMSLWKYLYISIKAFFPRYGLYLVGSTMSGFGLDASDMDLCLFVRPQESIDARSHALLHLGFVLNCIRSLGSEGELIQAKVPILKFLDPRHGLQVDLNCNNVVGIRNTNLLYCYSRLDWRVRPLVVISKLWAQAHNINDARQRTLSSYSLTLMVIHYLQCGVSPAVLPCLCVRSTAWEGAPHPRWTPPPHFSHNRQPLGELFVGFLKYYAEFQYDKMAVSVRAGCCVPVAECRAVRSHKNDPHQWKLLCVEEPFDLTNTARSVYDPETFEKVVKTFKTSHQALSASKRLQEAMAADER